MIIFVPQRLQGLVSYCICKRIILGLLKSITCLWSVISILGACYLRLGVFYDLVDDVLTGLLLP